MRSFWPATAVSVLALDASPQMIARAEQRLQHISPQTPVVFCELPTERIGELHPEAQFDGAFSNFSGLNCIADLDAVASSLAGLVKQNGRLVLCFSTRFCLIEILYYLSVGQWRKALRRCKGYTDVTIDGVSVLGLLSDTSQDSPILCAGFSTRLLHWNRGRCAAFLS